MSRKIVFATGNAGKLREIAEIMNEYEVVSMKDAGVNIDIDENGTTFEENALIKARAVWNVTGGIVLADDSGLEIDYLDKAPGIMSARFMGEDTSYHIKNAELIRRLEGVQYEDRTARFVAAVAAVLPDGTEKVVRATMEGYIGYEEAGENGFGYDPIFILPKYGVSTAELTMEQKNEESHRGKALRLMKKELEEN